MGNIGVVLLAALVVVYGLLSKRLSTTALTGPIVFMAFGLVAGPPALDWLRLDTGVRLVSLLLEATLVLVLFTDAFNIDVGKVRTAVQLPGRLLAIGLPVMVLIGWAAAAWLFPELGWLGALLVAVLLAPTDAALGLAVISNPRVPMRIRNALNIESGLNDGLALPLFFVVLSAASAPEGTGWSGGVLEAVVVQVLVASLVGVAVGAATARLGVAAVERGWAEAGWVQIALVGAALLAWGLADGWGASGFIAAWVAGLSCGIVSRARLDLPVEFPETLGRGLTLVVFAIFGATGLAVNISDMDGRIIVYAALSLGVIRMISVVIATAGTGLDAATKGFLGWFGPRGLASIILVLIVLEEGEVPGTPVIADLMVATVALSVLLHGATAWWGSNRYADRMASGS